jgi:hypothetical protein
VRTLWQNSVLCDDSSDVLDELVKKPAFSDYQLRFTEPKLCDPSVKQHSGYLDITDGKHLFFWYVVFDMHLCLVSHKA